MNERASGQSMGLVMKYSLRLLALVSSTLCGLFFLDKIINLLFDYNYTHHRFAPALVKPSDLTDTLLLGAGFLCSVILYRIFGRNLARVTCSHVYRVTDFPPPMLEPPFAVLAGPTLTEKLRREVENPVFSTFPTFHREISNQDRLGTTIENSVDP
jgi:hypothetical protein